MPNFTVRTFGYIIFVCSVCSCKYLSVIYFYPKLFVNMIYLFSQPCNFVYTKVKQWFFSFAHGFSFRAKLKRLKMCVFCACAYSYKYSTHTWHIVLNRTSKNQKRFLVKVIRTVFKNNICRPHNGRKNPKKLGFLKQIKLVNFRWLYLFNNEPVITKLFLITVLT